jgi:hypothetical protein
MTCDLTNPIFTDEAKVIERMEADRWSTLYRFCVTTAGLLGALNNLRRSKGRIGRASLPVCRNWSALSNCPRSRLNRILVVNATSDRINSVEQAGLRPTWFDSEQGSILVLRS